MSEYKVIHANVFTPHNALFKQSRNEKAETQTVTCNNSKNCNLLNQGECSFRAGMWGKRCPYGKSSTQTGFTKRASRYHQWVREQKELYKTVPFLKSPTVLAQVGEYVFLPYPFIDMCKEIPFIEHGTPFLKLEGFTADVVKILLHFKPQAISGGEITSYQKEVPPKLLKHLSEQMPELFKQIIDTDEYAMRRFKEFTNIGRKAILETTTPDVGEFRDIHGALWTWNGEILRSTNSHASFMLVSKFKEVLLIPEEKQEVKITNDGQVNDNTVFIN